MFKFVTRFMALALVAGGFTFGPTGGFSSAQASEFNAGTVMVRVRGLVVAPDVDDNLNNVVAGASLDVDDRFVPEIDITYFLTQNIALELVAAYTSHNVSANTGIGQVADVDIIPPHLMLQYHFNMGNGFKPYVGVGVGYYIVVDDDFDPAFRANGGLDFGNEWAFAIQAGFDYQLKDNVYLNVDVKKSWVNFETGANSGALAGTDVDLDPLLIGVGVGFRF